MDPKGSIHISYVTDPDDPCTYWDQGDQTFEFALHHLVETLGGFYRNGDIRVEEIDAVRLTISYEAGPNHRAQIVYSGGPIRHLNRVARWFVAETGSGSDEAKRLVRHEKRKNRRVYVT